MRDRDRESEIGKARPCGKVRVGNKREENVECEECGNAEMCNVEDEIGNP